MKDRPILFSAPMVRAILAGAKTQTRRIAPVRELRIASQFSHYGNPGDRLWVRETWMDMQGTGAEHRDRTGKLQRYAYAADTPPGSYGDECRKDYGLKWRPSIHMPRAASRITLEITGVRVERLHDISAGDCISEGIGFEVRYGGHCLPDGSHFNVSDPRQSYWSLWEAINGPGSVEANPWVWVVEFKRAAQADNALAQADAACGVSPGAMGSAAD